MPQNEEDWILYRKLVLAELERLSSCIARLEGTQKELEKTIAVLQFRSGMVAAGVSTLTSFAAALIAYLKLG